MYRKLILLQFLVFLSACWPGPSYKDKDPRCKEWNQSYRLHRDAYEIEKTAKSLCVIDRYSYFICINAMNSYHRLTPDVFVNDAETFMMLVKDLLKEKIPDDQLFLMSTVCLEIAREKPEIIKQYYSSVSTLEIAGSKVRHKFWRDWIMEKIQEIKQTIQ